MIYKAPKSQKESGRIKKESGCILLFYCKKSLSTKNNKKTTILLQIVTHKTYLFAKRFLNH